MRESFWNAYLTVRAGLCADRRWLGYSWREIAEDSLQMDLTVVRRAYFREVETLLNELSRSRGGRK